MDKNTILSLKLKELIMKICKKCNKNSIPNRLKINGKQYNLQNRKYCLECSPFKKHNTKILEKSNNTHKTCPKCTLLKPVSEFYQRRGKEGSSVYCKPCTTIQTVTRQRSLKNQAIQYKGGKCSVCGYDKCNGALTFHHLNPSKKEFSIANCALTSFEKVKRELDKCILVCYNCHMEIHYN